MSDKIKAALQKLDPSNENHWTQDGLAKLETVKFLNDGDSVSREDLDKDFAGFNKTTAAGFFMDTGPGKIDGPDQNPGQDANGVITGIKLDERPVVEGETEADRQARADNPGEDNVEERAGQDANGDLVGVVAPSVGSVPPELHNPATIEAVAAPGSTGAQAAAELTESPRDDGAGAAAQASQPDDEDGAEGTAAAEAELAQMGERIAGEDDLEDLEAQLEDTEEKIASIRREVDHLNKGLEVGNSIADKLRGRISQLKGGSDNTATIQAYLESRKGILQQRGENRAALKDSGLSLKQLALAVGGSPIDQAMARKTARGGKRPTRV